MLARLALGNVRKSLADFGIYFLTVMLGVAVFYAFNSMTAQQGVLAFSETQSKMFDLLGMVIGGVSVFIAFVLVFLVVYANSFLIKRRKREFGVYLALGMSTGDVVKIVALESLIAGAASLAAGLVVGIGLSQLLLQLTSALFQADVAEAGGFAFVFSADALAKTAIVFAAIFLTAALLNARTVARAKLIDLLHAQRKNEEMRLTSLPLSLALFAASLVLIGVSYKLLIDNGLMEPSPEFAAATLLVCAGTVLFFYALSGFLLKLVQLIKPLYLRGLNMFALRQLNAKVNTAFASLSVVCLVLFLAITSVCGGIGIRNAIDGSLDKSTGYSASVSTSFGSYNAEAGYQPAELGEFGAFAERQGYDMAAGLRASVAAVGAGDFDAAASRTAQIDFLVDPADGLVMDDVERASGLKLSDYAGASVNSGYGAYPVYLAKLSQVNAARAGRGGVRGFQRLLHHERVLPRRGGSRHRAVRGRARPARGRIPGREPADHAVSDEHGHARGARRGGAGRIGDPPVRPRRAVRKRRGRGRVRRDDGRRGGHRQPRHLADHAVHDARRGDRPEHQPVHHCGVPGHLPGLRAGHRLCGHTRHPAAVRRFR